MNAVDHFGQTALHYAAFRCNQLAVALLLERGAKVHATTTNGRNALDIVLSSPNASDPEKLCGLIRLLVRAGLASIVSPNLALILGQHHDMRRPLELLLQSSVLDLRAAEAVSPFSLLTSPTSLSLLLRYGLDESARDHEGNTLFARMAMNTCSEGGNLMYRLSCTRCLLLMLIRGADLSTRSPPDGPTHATLLASLERAPLPLVVDLTAPRAALRKQCLVLFEHFTLRCHVHVRESPPVTKDLVPEKLP